MAKVDIPELAPGIHFFPPQNIRFKVVAVLGIVSDLFITDKGMNLKSEYQSIGNAVESFTPWVSASNLGFHYPANFG